MGLVNVAPSRVRAGDFDFCNKGFVNVKLQAPPEGTDIFPGAGTAKVDMCPCLPR